MMKRNAGLTLVEVVVAAAILAAVFAMTMQIFFSSARTAADQSLSGRLDERGVRLADIVKAQFLTGRFRDPMNVRTLGIYEDNTQVRYQVPVNRDASGAMQYGYTARLGANDPDGQDRMAVLRFEADTILREGPLAPAVPGQPPATSPLPALPPLPGLRSVTLGFDVNRDGDLSDAFARGRIRKYVIAPAGALLPAFTETLSDEVILAVSAAGRFNGKVDPSAPGGPEADWLFRFVDASGATVATPVPGATVAAVALAAWHGRVDDSGRRFVLRKSSETVRFRNPQ